MFKSHTQRKKLPEIDQTVTGFEKHAQKSINVLVSIVGSIGGIGGLVIGRYYHTLKKWQISGFHGEWTVIEWWSLPEIGTGNKL